MHDWLHRIFSSDEFMPHGMCYLWNPRVIWLNVASDALIALAYYSIPLTLLYFVRRRRDLEFGWMFVCFAIFIIACGTTHLMEIVNVWHPVYWVTGVVKAITAAVSILTAILLVRSMPAALALPSPRAMERATATLRANQDQLRTDARRLALATQVLHAGIWEWDLRTGALIWNETMYEIYGRTKDHPIDDQVWAETVLAEDFPRMEANLRRVIATKSQGSTEFRIARPDGSIRHVEAAEGVVLDEAGEVLRVVGVNLDVTERKKLDHHLLHAQRMESIGTLASGIAHDLNNILAPITMSIGLLQATAQTPAAQGILETIAASAKRGAEIVRQVLSFARGVESSKVEVQPKHQLDELKNIIQNTFPKILQLEFSLAEEVWPILADPTQLFQVLLNLCVNARDAMPDGGTLTIGLQNCVLEERLGAMNLRAKAGRYVRIDVTDTGIGMPATMLDRIFEPFFTTKVLTKGTGLGLSTVYTIVKSHGGIIEVSSEPGHGSTFRVYFPAAVHPSAARETTAAVGRPRGHGELLLLVDDENGLRTITEQVLTTFGYRVLAAANGADAVELYSQHQDEIALVITDLNMPVMDGGATIKALLQLNPAARIIAVSGLNENSEMLAESRPRIRKFLAKPYMVETLLTTIQAALREE